MKNSLMFSFTGKIIGDNQGEIINGKLEGEMLELNKNGDLFIKGNWKNGKLNGELLI